MTTTKIINTYYAGGYKVAKYTNLYISPKGGVGGLGVEALYNLTIKNDGTVHSAGGKGAVFLGAGGLIINGSFAYTTATLAGEYGVAVGSGAGAVVNFGTIRSADSIYGQNVAVIFDNSGVLTNGSAIDTGALVLGYNGVDTGVAGSGVGSITNFGTIIGALGTGVLLHQGGNVTNGAVTDRVATIDGATAGVYEFIAGTVTNFGSISAFTAAHGAAGVELTNGGHLFNGSAGDPGASINGYTGARLNAAGVVANYGTIRGYGASSAEFGVYLAAGGTVINGAGTDRLATVEGATGVAIAGGLGTIRNSGTIQADQNNAGAFGVELGAGGTIVNGSGNNHSALIQGSSGLYMIGGAGQNFGTISAVGDGGAGVRLTSGASLTNGATGHANAVIEGYNGIATPTGAVATVTNFGTIEGIKAAVYFHSSTDVLNVEAGSTFLGAVYGGGGTLDVANGTGTLSNLFSSTGIVVSGSMAATTFQGFGTVEVGLGAYVTDAGMVTLAAGQTLNAAGALTLSGDGKNSVVNAGLIETTGGGVLSIFGSVINTGTIEAAGGAIAISSAVSGAGVLAVNGGDMVLAAAVTGAGKATINSGVLQFESLFTQNVTFTGTTGRLQLAQSQTYTGAITNFSKTGSTSLDLLDIAFVTANEATFSGNTTSGVLTVTDGTHTAKINLKGNYTASTFVCSSDGRGGVIVVDPAKTAATASPLAMLSAMAGLGAPASVSQSAPAWSGSSPFLISPRATAG